MTKEELNQTDARGNELNPVQSTTTLPKYDCDDCKHYPCIHQEMVDTTGDDAKLKYDVCGDHSSRGCA